MPSTEQVRCKASPPSHCGFNRGCSWAGAGSLGVSERQEDLHMKRNALGITTGGEQRLRKTIEAQVRREHQDELSAATDHWQKAAIKEKIEQEIEERMKRV